MVTLQIETVGTERFIRAFNRMSKEIKDFREPYRDVAEDFYQMEEDIFIRKGYPTKWSSEIYTAAYARRKGVARRDVDMILKGRLAKSLMGVGQAGAGDTVREIKKMEATFGTNVPYAHRHQEGTHGMPKRKIVQLTEARKRKWAKIFQKWAMETVGAAIRPAGWRAWH